MASRLLGGMLISSSLVLLAPTAARAETLADAVALAYASNPNIQAQRAAQRALDETYVQARAGFGLTAQASAEYVGQQLSGSFLNGAPPLLGQSPAGSLQIRQPLFSGGRLTARLSAAEADVLSGREALRESEIQLLDQVVSAYAAVIRDQGVLRVETETLNALDQQRQETDVRSRERDVTLTDVALVATRLSAERSRVVQAQGQLAVTRGQYLSVVGQNPGELAPPPPLEDLPATLETALDRAETANPTLLRALFAERAARARVQEAKAAFLPSADVSLGLSSSPAALYNPAIGRENTVTVTATVTQPLFTSGLNSSVVRQSLEQQNQQKFTVDAARRNAIQGVVQAWTQLVTARRQLDADQTTITAAAQALAGTRVEEPYGLRNRLDILNAQQELNAAEIARLQHRYDEYVGQANVLAASGTLDLTQLSPDTPRYRPDASFQARRNIGRLPLEPVARALDKLIAPALPPPPPQSPAARPDQAAPLPAAPSKDLEPALPPPASP